MRTRAAAGAVTIALLAAGCGDGADDPTAEPSPSSASSSAPPGDEPSEPSGTPDQTPDETPGGEPSEEPSEPAAPSSGPPRVVGTVATGLQAPWGLDFLPDGDAVVTERDTRRVLRVAPGGRVTELGVLEQAVPDDEGGLLGVAVSPDFATDALLYFYLTTPQDNRVVRAPLRGDRLGRTTVVLDGIPRSTNHDGGRLAFGPDGLLHASTGDALQPDLAQDRDSLGGKILRIDPATPGARPEVVSLGHRNVQGLAFDDTGQLWASEFGDQAFDELNRIDDGGNYGWPQVEGRGGPARFVPPQQVWATDDNSPSGLAFAAGHLWMAALQGERLWRVTVEGRRAVRPRGFLVGDFGRMRTVVAAPDGTLWVTTSNRDGRGDPAAEDDRILRIRP